MEESAVVNEMTPEEISKIEEEYKKSSEHHRPVNSIFQGNTNFEFEVTNKDQIKSVFDKDMKKDHKFKKHPEFDSKGSLGNNPLCEPCFPKIEDADWKKMFDQGEIEKTVKERSPECDTVNTSLFKLATHEHVMRAYRSMKVITNKDDAAEMVANSFAKELKKLILQQDVNKQKMKQKEEERQLSLFDGLVCQHGKHIE